jgi:hypothetical protein
MLRMMQVRGPGRVARISALPAMLLAAACESPNAPLPPSGAPPVVVASVEIAGQHGPLTVGAELQLHATPRAAGGTPLDRPVTWSSADTAIATVSSSGLVRAKRAGVAAITAASDARASTLSIEIRNVAPVLTRLAPASAEVFSAELTLTVHGSGFAPGAVVHWNGRVRPTTVVSATEVTIELNRVDLHEEAVRTVHVVNPGGIGGYHSGPLQFEIIPGSPVRTQYRLMGVETRRWPTTFIGETIWTDDHGSAHAAVRYVTGGTLTFTHQTGRITRWELRLYVETHLVDRVGPVRSTSMIDGGELPYDRLNTSARLLKSSLSGVTWSTRALGIDRFVMLHRIGGLDLPWLFEL